MENFQQYTRNLLQIFGEAIAVSESQKNATLAQHLRSEAEHLREGKLCVVVAGEFKQGKSSLVNALLDEPGLFPETPDIATCLVSTISYGEEERVKVMLGEGDQTVTEAIRREQIRNYVLESQNPNNVRNARMLMIKSPNPRLRDGLVLVDTPGTGGLFKKHSEITYQYLPKADAVLYVSDAFSPLSVQDLAFVEKIAAYCKQIIFVLTKIDLVEESQYQEVMQGNREKLTKALNCPADEIRMVPVSSSLKLNYLRSREQEVLEESNFPGLERELRNTLGHRRDILLNRALFVLEQAVTEMVTPLEAEKEALQHGPQVEEIKQQINAAIERKRQLESDTSEWRIQLQQGMQAMRESVSHTFQYDFVELRKKLGRYLDSNELLQKPDTVPGMVEEDIYQVMTSLDQTINEQIAQLHARVQQLTGLDIHSVAVNVRDYTKPNHLSTVPVALSQPEKQLSRWDKLMIGLSRGKAEAGGASVLGAIVGGALGLGVDILTLGTTGFGGVVIGSMLGSQIAKVAGYRSGIARGLKQMKDQSIAETRRTLEKELVPFIEQSKLLCNRTLNEALKTVDIALQEEFRTLIERERLASENILRTMNEAQNLSREAAQKRLQEIAPVLERLARLQSAIQQGIQQVAFTSSQTDNEREVTYV